MGYVEDIQKINNLARELLSHGMASSLDEAVEKAKEHLKGEVDLASIPNPTALHKEAQGEASAEPHSEVKVEEAPVQAVTPQGSAPQEAPADKSGMTWQQAMKKNNEFLVKTFKQHEEFMKACQEEIAGLKAELKSLKKMQHARPAEPQQKLDEPKQEKKDPHPRGGEFKPEDVAVDKMFYFGTGQK